MSCFEYFRSCWAPEIFTHNSLLGLHRMGRKTKYCVLSAVDLRRLIDESDQIKMSRTIWATQISTLYICDEEKSIPECTKHDETTFRFQFCPVHRLTETRQRLKKKKSPCLFTDINFPVTVSQIPVLGWQEWNPSFELKTRERQGDFYIFIFNRPSLISLMASYFCSWLTSVEPLVSHPIRSAVLKTIDYYSYYIFFGVCI